MAPPGGPDTTAPPNETAGRGRLFVVTGPSGAGKGTLIRALLRRRSDLRIAVSATTRPQRPGEEDGRHYHFIDEAEFERTGPRRASSSSTSSTSPAIATAR